MRYRNEILRGVRLAAIGFVMVLGIITAQRIVRVSFTDNHADSKPKPTAKRVVPDLGDGPAIPPEPGAPHGAVRARRAAVAPATAFQPTSVYPPDAVVTHPAAESQIKTIIVVPAADTSAAPAPAVQAASATAPPVSDPADTAQTTSSDGRGKKMAKAVAHFLHMGVKKLDSAGDPQQ